MDEFLSTFEMLFHPLMETNIKHFKEEKVLSRNNVKLLTYNIFLRPPPVKNNENDWKDERLADFIKLLDSFDIVCLQECFGSLNNRKQELIKYANKTGLFFFVDSPSPSFFSKFLVDGGLLTMSRFPIVESEFREFRYCVLSDSLANKGILYSKIKIRDSYVIIFNTHTQASYFGSPEYLWNISVRTRLDHLDEMCEFIKEILLTTYVDEETTVLLMGDFNVDAHNYEKKKSSTNMNYNNFQDEYKYLMNKLNDVGITVDIFKSAHNHHPYTFGYNGDHLKHYDQVLTLKEDIGSYMTLDYIFELNAKKYVKRNSDALVDKKSKMVIDYNSAQVEYFLVSDKPYQQLSDHFGLSLDLKYVSEGV